MQHAQNDICVQSLNSRDLYVVFSSIWAAPGREEQLVNFLGSDLLFFLDNLSQNLSA